MASWKMVHDREVEQRRKWAGYTFLLLVAAALIMFVVAISVQIIGFTVR